MNINEQEMGTNPEKHDQKGHKNPEDHTPLWIKLFGGTVVSIMFLCVISVVGYIVTNLNNLQFQINSLNAETVTKKEFNERQKSMWDTNNLNAKTTTDTLQNVRERLNGLELVSKDRIAWLEKCDLKMKEMEKNQDTLSRDLTSYREKIGVLEGLNAQLKEDVRQYQKDAQLIRERLAVLEGKKTP